MWNKNQAQPSQVQQNKVTTGPATTAPLADASAISGRKPGEGEESRASVGRSIVVKGEIAGSEDLTLDGQVEGRIDLPDHVLTVGPNAVIRADITAKAVTIFGQIIGGVTVRDKADVRKSGSVEGHLSCGRLAVQEGAHLTGKIESRGERYSAQKPATGDGRTHTLAPVA